MLLPPLWKVKRELVRVWTKTKSPFLGAADPYRQSNHDRKFDQRVRITESGCKIGDRVAILVIFQPKGIADSTYMTLDHLVANRFDVIVVCNGPHPKADVERLGKVAVMTVERPNIGYDFGAYRDGLRIVRSKGVALTRLVFMNDSTWFPLRETDDTLERMDAKCGGLIGHVFKVRSTDRKFAHVESHLLMFSGEGVNSQSFNEFWAKFVMSNRHSTTVQRGEKQLTQKMLTSGLAVDCLASRELMLALLSKLNSAALREVASNVLHHREDGRVFIRDILARWDTDEGASGEFMNWVNLVLSKDSYQLSTSFIHPAMRYGIQGFVKKKKSTRFHLARKEVLRMEAEGLIPPLNLAVRTEMLALVDQWKQPQQK